MLHYIILSTFATLHCRWGVAQQVIRLKATRRTDDHWRRCDKISLGLTGAFYVGNEWVAGGCWGLLGLLLIVTGDYY